MLAHDDVARLDVAVQVPPRLCAYSMALQTSVNRRKSLRSSRRTTPRVGLQNPIGVEALDGLLEAVAADEPHGVIRAAIAIGAESVDRDDAGVLEPAGDLGLDEEPGAAGRVVGVVVEDLLERDLAIELGVECDEDRAQASAGVRPEYAEAEPAGGGGADGEAGGAVAVGVGLAVMGRGLQGRGGDGGRPEFPRRPSRAGSSRGVEGPAGMAARLFSGSLLCFLRCLDARASTGRGRSSGSEVALDDEVLGQGPGFVEDAGLEGGDQPGLVDQSVLGAQQSEEQSRGPGASRPWQSPEDLVRV